MCWLIVCPACGELLEFDDNGKSVPNGEYYKLIEDYICGKCGQDMRTSIKQAVDKITPEPISYKTK